MNKLPEPPDDVDIFVGPHESTPEEEQEFAEWLKAHKARPEYAAEKAEADRILKDMGWTPGEDGKWNIPGWTYDTNRSQDGNTTTA